jgi:hypothetical protein
VRSAEDIFTDEDPSVAAGGTESADAAEARFVTPFPKFPKCGVNLNCDEKNAAGLGVEPLNINHRRRLP